ncbi:8426_t:CDS:2, partial [Dentiscutata erythropus]
TSYRMVAINLRPLGMDELLQSLNSQYGDILELWFGSNRAVVLCHPKYMVKIHQTSTKSKYIKRFQNINNPDGKEYGIVDSGVFNNNDIHGSWKFNRMVFSNALMRPKLDRDALQWTIELVEEMESYWKRAGIIIDDNDMNKALIEDKEIINLPDWMRRFTYDMIYRIAIGTKGDALNSYTNKLCGLNTYETESNSIIKSTQTYAEGIMYFRLFSKFVRNYFPYIRGIIRSNKNIGERSEDGDDIKNSFVMFGGGLRMCPGRKLAMIELKCLVTMIYRKYDVELVDMNVPLKTKSTFLTSCEELLFRLKLRK